VAETVVLAAVQDVIHREARLLDAQDWAGWLALYCDDAVFWVPAVTMAGAYTSDPQTELNFIYIDGRAGLEARVFRAQSGGSLASNPLPRTRHLVTMVTVDEDSPRDVRAFANFQVISFSEARGQQMRSGSYEYVLRKRSSGLQIAQKKVLLLEYMVDGYFDFFTI
jgi:benzoate/toluate 1,2-dioxygenase beta subunit/2,4,5-trichlorophenoxyacetic acid oxygenase 2